MGLVCLLHPYSRECLSPLCFTLFFMSYWCWGSIVRTPLEWESWELSHSPRHHIQPQISLLRALLNMGWGAMRPVVISQKPQEAWIFLAPIFFGTSSLKYTTRCFPLWKTGIWAMGGLKREWRWESEPKNTTRTGGERTTRGIPAESPPPPAVPAFQLLSAIFLPPPSSLVVPSQRLLWRLSL